MTTKQSAAVASGLHTDYYHHEDKLMEQNVCVRVCMCGCVHSKSVCVNVCTYCVFPHLCVSVCWTSAKGFKPVFQCVCVRVHVCAESNL